ncbi:MAG: hypothetical protein IJ744_05485 [Lachnospiraceae bacterium]|nr:hypothetical protein [Lachnospiraceae bacterium]
MSTIIICPLRVFSLSNWGVADESKLVYRPLGSLVKQIYPYDSVEVETESIDGNLHYILINSAGEEFDLNAHYKQVYESEHSLDSYVLNQLEKARALKP